MKRCKVCGELKPLDAFYTSAGMRDGHRHDCKACNLAAKKRRYDADPRREIARVKKWQQENAERLNAYRREHIATPERRRRLRDGYYRRTHGISADDFDALLEAQGGVCAICRAPAPTHLDHDHITGAIRGILCVNCNHGLGKFGDDVDLLRRAVAYLRGR